jgi:cell division protein FtsL
MEALKRFFRNKLHVVLIVVTILCAFGILVLNSWQLTLLMQNDVALAQKVEKNRELVEYNRQLITKQVNDLILWQDQRIPWGQSLENRINKFEK